MIANIVGGESNGEAIRVPDDTHHFLMAKKTPIVCTTWAPGMVPAMSIGTESYTMQRWAKGPHSFAFLVLNNMPEIESRAIIHRLIEGEKAYCCVAL